MDSEKFISIIQGASKKKIKRNLWTHSQFCNFNWRNHFKKIDKSHITCCWQGNWIFDSYAAKLSESAGVFRWNFTIRKLNLFAFNVNTKCINKIDREKFLATSETLNENHSLHFKRPKFWICSSDTKFYGEIFYFVWFR